MNNIKGILLLIVTILVGAILFSIGGELPKMIKEIPNLIKDLVPNMKIGLAYLYIAIVSFLIGKFTNNNPRE